MNNDLITLLVTACRQGMEPTNVAVISFKENEIDELDRYRYSDKMFLIVKNNFISRNPEYERASFSYQMIPHLHNCKTITITDQEFKVSNRVKNILSSEFGYSNVVIEVLTEKTEDELLKIKHIGNKTINEIKSALKEFNLHLKQV